MANIVDLEVARVGPGLTERDLDDMVAAFDGVGYRVPLRLNDDGRPGALAYGWVDRVRRAGLSLLVTLSDVPLMVQAAIVTRRYGSMAIDVFHDLARNGRRFRRALAAVSLRGVDLPDELAVLKHFGERQGHEGHASGVHTYTASRPLEGLVPRHWPL
jgi:hypothetical protein